MMDLSDEEGGPRHRVTQVPDRDPQGDPVLVTWDAIMRSATGRHRELAAAWEAEAGPQGR